MDKKSLKIFFFSLFFLSLFLSTYSQCSYTFPSNKVYTHCSVLPRLNSFLHWNYNHSSGTVEVAYRHPGIDTSSSWVAWGLNPTESGMKGTQALVALKNSSGSVHVYTSAIVTHGTKLKSTPLSLEVPSLSAEYKGGQMIIYATLVLPKNRTTFNHVWQNGTVSGSTPDGHPTKGDNVRTMATVDFLSGQTNANLGWYNSQRRKKNVHGILATISWGILMPIGIMIARYLKVFKSANPAWFYLHAICQSLAFVLGIAGCATGIKVRTDSIGSNYTSHRVVGLLLFFLGLFQMSALLYRPQKDHKFRFYWNIYHWGLGYSIVLLSIFNVFCGLDIYQPPKKWKDTYIGIIISLVAISAFLEAFTWYIVIKRRREEN